MKKIIVDLRDSIYLLNSEDKLSLDNFYESSLFFRLFLLFLGYWLFFIVGLKTLLEIYFSISFSNYLQSIKYNYTSKLLSAIILFLPYIGLISIIQKFMKSVPPEYKAEEIITNKGLRQRKQLVLFLFFLSSLFLIIITIFIFKK